jgi:hypothetical protein
MSHLCYKGWNGLDRTLDNAAWKLLQDILFYYDYAHAHCSHVILYFLRHITVEDTWASCFP